MYCANTLCHAVTLTFDPLTLKVRGTSSVTWSKSQNLAEISNPGWIIDNFVKFCTRHDVILTFDLLTLNFYSTSVVMRLNSVQNFERNWIIHHWVIADLPRFRCAVLGVGHDWQLNQTWQGHRAIIPTQEVCFRISCCIFKCRQAAQSWVMSKEHQILHFLTPVKIRVGVDEISIAVVEALPTTEPLEYIWWPSTAPLLSVVDW